VFPARKGPCKRGIDSGEGRWTLAKVKMVSNLQKCPREAFRM
jgi:hypothetical protein